MCTRDMLTFHFSKAKNGDQQLVDCLPFEAIAGYSNGLKDPHTTSFYELFWFPQVEGKLWADGEPIELSGPTAIMLPPFTVRSWQVDQSADSYVLFFVEDFVDGFLKDTAFLHRLHFFSYKQQSPVLPLSKEHLARISELYASIRSELGKSNLDRLFFVQAYWYQLLLHLNRLYGEHYRLSDRCYENTEIIRLKTLLKQHIQHKQTVQDYAEMMDINRNQLNALCLRFYGENANVVIRNSLLQVCKSELLSSKLTIAEISYKFNFSAPPNFSRFFKRYVGLTPAEYREKYSV
ncbi:AraC-like DNA-binding protein [Mangrovibacterium marinum]|uniref:AraC-like DNA-binding protein n=2 Tax=Mangrovibacterium marinum TaxID=1639118 RepID=A0A2T5C1N3_9BACT|nr:AraC-like DNA-binding protein [Mangrovibacterium marinum]